MITAAHALLDNEHLHRDEVVPTLAFAALAEEMPGLAAIQEQFAQAGRDAKRWRYLRLKFWDLFGPWWPKRYDDKVLIVRRDAINMVVGYEPDTNVTNVIEIEVADNSIGRAEVADLYKRALDTYEVDSQGSPAGGADWSVHEGKIRMVVRPEGHTLDPHHLPTRRPDEQPTFPDPNLVADMYVVLRGSEGAKNRFSGFGIGSEVLPGRDRARKAEGSTLVPACVAWYAANRGPLEDPQHRVELARRLANEDVLRHGGKCEQLRRDVAKRLGSFQEAEEHILSRLG